METVFRFVRLVLATCVLVALLIPASCTTPSTPEATEEPMEQPTEELAEEPTEEPTKEPTTLRVAIIGNPPMLDIQATTATITSDIARHINEGLFAFDEDYTPVPDLVEEYAVSADGTEYTFTLRDGVKFHNGKQLTAEDAVASIERSGVLSSMGRSMFTNIERLEATGDREFVMELEHPNPAVLIWFSLPWSFVFPKEVVDKYPEKPIDDNADIIGTGPFELDEYLPDRYVRLAKYADYTPREEAPSGQAGRKEAKVDYMEFVPVPDASVRIAGTLTGEYHIGMGMAPDEFERLSEEEGVSVEVVKPFRWHFWGIHHRNSLGSNKLIRKAIQATLDMEPIMQAAVGPEELWRLDPGLMFQEQPMWTDAGKEFYNQADTEKARQLLEEAGYEGEPLRILTSQQYPAFYKVALAAKPQLEEAGFTVELDVVDWATLVELREDYETYTIYTTGIGFASVQDPTVMLILDPESRTRWVNEEVQDLLQQMRVEEDEAERYRLWEEIQYLFYEDVAHIKFGDQHDYRLVRNEVKGFVPGTELWLWNVSLES